MKKENAELGSKIMSLDRAAKKEMQLSAQLKKAEADWSEYKAARDDVEGRPRPDVEVTTKPRAVGAGEPIPVWVMGDAKVWVTDKDLRPDEVSERASERLAVLDESWVRNRLHDAGFRDGHVYSRKVATTRDSLTKVRKRQAKLKADLDADARQGDLETTVKESNA